MHGISNKVVSSSKKDVKRVIPRPLRYHPYVSRTTAWVRCFIINGKHFDSLLFHTFDINTRTVDATPLTFQQQSLLVRPSGFSPSSHRTQHHNSPNEFETIDDNDWAVKPTYHIRQ